MSEADPFRMEVAPVTTYSECGLLRLAQLLPALQPVQRRPPRWPRRFQSAHRTGRTDWAAEEEESAPSDRLVLRASQQLQGNRDRTTRDGASTMAAADACVLAHAYPLVVQREWCPTLVR